MLQSIEPHTLTTKHLQELPADEKRHICVAMRDFATQIATLPEVGQNCGIESNVIASCLRNIDRVADDLSKISV